MVINNEWDRNQYFGTHYIPVHQREHTILKQLPGGKLLLFMIKNDKNNVQGLSDSLADGAGQEEASFKFTQEELFLLYAPGNNLFGSEDGGCSFLDSIISLQRSSFYIKENPDVPEGNQSI